MKQSKILVQSFAFILAASLIFGGFSSKAVAATIGAQDLLSQGRENSESTADLRQAVSQRLVQLGVDDAMAQERVAALTQDELQLLDQKLDELPAGAGALEVIGIVFLVLLILELVGITHIFKKF